MAHKKNNTNLTELLLQCVTQPDPMLSMLEWLCTQLMEAEWISSWAQRKVSAQTEEAATAAATVLVVWIPAWERCTSWCPRFVRAVISRSLLRNASAVRLRSFRSFKRHLYRAFPLGKWRSWHRVSALKICPAVRSAR